MFISSIKAGLRRRELTTKLATLISKQKLTSINNLQLTILNMNQLFA